ncbi:MAG: hypothetical protein IKR68_04445 [Lachnospiraceae bacterium]|nr:hypothetical protein [Lachnospiraceae bacterium]
MKKSIITILRRILFLVLLAASLIFINTLLMPKYSYLNSDWPTTATFEEFYDMEPQSIDVLFFGSSVAASAFNPQEVYNYRGIRSYNLSSEQQSLFLSYYWLKEALNYQSPKVVVADLKFLFPVHPESAINTSEPITRKCLDIMKISGVKKEAVKDLCTLDPAQSELGYYLTNIRFHSRWSSLDEQDFTPSDYADSPLKGYAPLSYKGPKDYTPLELTGSGDFASCDPLMVDYLGRINALCKEHGISLILTYMAEEGYSEGEHNTMQKIADEQGVAFYDFSEKTTYEKVGARLRRENIVEHPNLWGSEKLSRFLADELTEKYGIQSVADAQWENSKPFYEHIKKTCELSQIDDLKEFFNAVNDPDYTTLIVVRRDGASVAGDELAEGMKAVGLSDIREFERESYLAVVTPGKAPVEMHSKDALTYRGALGNDRSVYVLSSTGFYSGNSCSITIDGKEITDTEIGLHIVVYDNVQKKVVETKDIS